MKFNININKEEEKDLKNIWREVLKNFPEDVEVEKDMYISIDRYVSDNGIPATAEHEALYGDELEEYLNKGLDFEDCRVILED